jgi:hypothetical protein
MSTDRDTADLVVYEETELHNGTLRIDLRKADLRDRRGLQTTNQDGKVERNLALVKGSCSSNLLDPLEAGK